MFPARVLVLPVMEPTMMQRGAPAGLFLGDSFRSSSRRLTSRKWPRWLVLRAEGRGKDRVNLFPSAFPPHRWKCSHVPGRSEASNPAVQAAMFKSSPNRKLKAVSSEGGLLGSGQVHGRVGHQGIQAAAAATRTQ